MLYKTFRWILSYKYLFLIPTLWILAYTHVMIIIIIEVLAGKKIKFKAIIHTMNYWKTIKFIPNLNSGMKDRPNQLESEKRKFHKSWEIHVCKWSKTMCWVKQYSDLSMQEHCWHFLVRKFNLNFNEHSVVKWWLLKIPNISCQWTNDHVGEMSWKLYCQLNKLNNISKIDSDNCWFFCSEYFLS